MSQAGFSATVETAESPLRLAMLGMIPGNGHPYSWSAIVNGYDRVAMARCPLPAIPRYLDAQPPGSVKIAGAEVTHIWTDAAADAPAVAAAACIPNIVGAPEAVIGEVDAVLIATDDGFDHVRRARPFVEAGLPVFVDKPLALTVGDLRIFAGWERAGAKLLSSSGLRFSPELEPLTGGIGLGAPRWISGLTFKTWERYGIHLLEPISRLLGPGFESIRLESRPGLEIAHLVHRSGVQVSIPVIVDGGALFGTVHFHGTGGSLTVRLTDTYTAFRRQLVGFIDYVRTGIPPYPFAETIELMAVIIAGIRSRTENSRRVEVSEIQSELHP